jgi:chemotaxis protein methyltransferase CheR
MRNLDHVFFEGSVRLRTRPLPAAPIARPAKATAAKPGEMHEFLTWLLNQGGLDVEHYREASLTRRVASCLRELRVGSVAAARQKLEEEPALFPRALDAVLLGVTQFFRDAPVFDCLRDQVLPALLGGPEPVRVWSAACSDGSELYSVAMVLGELGGLAGSDLLGTDCRRNALAHACAGVYPAEAFSRVSPRMKERFVVGEGISRRIADVLRIGVRWAQQDLFKSAAPGPWDLVLWRNMAIYLRPEAADLAWRAIWRELRPGGFLVSGKADVPPRGLRWRRVAASVFQKEGADS